MIMEGIFINFVLEEIFLLKEKKLVERKDGREFVISFYFIFFF